MVLVRCISNKASFQEEISDNLGRSFPRVAFIVVLVYIQISHTTRNLLTFLLLSVLIKLNHLPEKDRTLVYPRLLLNV